MIPAHKRAAFNFVVRRWVLRMIRRRFHNVYLVGSQRLKQLDPNAPIVGCVNHSNWWDGFVLYLFSHLRLPQDIYLAMEEKNLRRYRFFTWMGVFGLNLANRRAALPGLRYALQLLAPGRLVWMFVQGRMRPAHVPVDVRPGAGFLARKTGAQLLPLSLRYEWLNESRPSIFVCVGEPCSAALSDEKLAAILNALFAEVGTHLEPVDLKGCEPLFPPKRSLNKRWDYFRHRLSRRRDVFDNENR